MRATRLQLERRIDQALGDARADVVIRNGRTLNLVTGDLDVGDIAICDDTIVGTLGDYRGETEIDARGKIVVPGFIDSHVHCESTLVTPGEFNRCELAPFQDGHIEGSPSPRCRTRRNGKLLRL